MQIVGTFASPSSSTELTVNNSSAIKISMWHYFTGASMFAEIDLNGAIKTVTNALNQP